MKFSKNMLLSIAVLLSSSAVIAEQEVAQDQTEAVVVKDANVEPPQNFKEKITAQLEITKQKINEIRATKTYQYSAKALRNAWYATAVATGSVLLGYGMMFGKQELMATEIKCAGIVFASISTTLGLGLLADGIWGIKREWFSANPAEEQEEQDAPEQENTLDEQPEEESAE